MINRMVCLAALIGAAALTLGMTAGTASGNPLTQSAQIAALPASPDPTAPPESPDPDPTAPPERPDPTPTAEPTGTAGPDPSASPSSDPTGDQLPVTSGIRTLPALLIGGFLLMGLGTSLYYVTRRKVDPEP
jgi:hypothetical protein